jgi:hypothetical protein
MVTLLTIVVKKRNNEENLINGFNLNRIFYPIQNQSYYLIILSYTNDRFA